MLLSLADTVAEAALLVVLAAAGLSVAVRAWAQPHAGNPWALVALYLVPLGALFGTVSMVSSAVHTFLIDRRFGLSTQSVAAWFIDGLKGFLVSGLLGLGAIEILYALLRRFPETWWIWTAAVFSLLLVFLAQLAPVLIFPIFFKFKKIKDEEIVARLQRLAERAGTRVAGIYEMNLSRKTRAVNAALAGFGRTRRIIMADTLLDRFSLDEIEAIMAHEMAHHKYHHLPMGVALQTLSFFVLFFAVHYVLRFAGPRLGYEGMADVAGFPLIALCGMLFGLILLPVTNGLLRGFERQADAYAMRTATRPEAFIIALRRLGQLNLADQTPNPVIEWIFYSHPSIQNRIRHAEEVLKERQ
jgi:STE24 endopeptidase